MGLRPTPPKGACRPPGPPGSREAAMRLSAREERALEFLERERTRALDASVTAFRTLRQAQSDYEAAIMRAHKLGVTSSAIARRVGMSETAIRLYVKRRKDKE